MELRIQFTMDVETVKQFITGLVRWEHTCLCLLVVINLAIHFSVIQNPPRVVLDEVYYVNNARLILNEHTDNRTEHPPLGKLLITANVALLGDNPFGWRTFPVVFGSINIVLLYLICRRLKMSRKATNIVVFLLTFENLSFVQSGLAMLDVFSLTFTLLAFWLYLKGNYPLSAVSIALAVLTKLTAVLAIPVILLHWLIARRDRPLHAVASMTLALVSFLLLLLALESAIYRHLVDLISCFKAMIYGSTSLTFATTDHPHIIPPWEWLIVPKIMPYFYNPNYFGVISFTLWALIIPAFIYMVVKAIKNNEAGLFGILWFAGTYLLWIPIILITNRVTYVYYFYPAVGAVCLGLGMGLSQMIDYWKSKTTGKLRWCAIIFVIFFLILHVGVYFFLSPINPWRIEFLLLE